MTTELERRLREALLQDAERARVVNPNEPPAVQLRPMSDDQHPRRPARKLVAAAAAVAVLALLGGALALRDDDQSVDTTPPVTQLPVAPAPGTVYSGRGCPFGIAGDPIELREGPELLVDDRGGVDPRSARFDTQSGQGVAHALVGSHVVEVRVPGFDERASDDGWREETIELDRGPGRVWLDGPTSGVGSKSFVQVRYFPESEQRCSSFTVTVDGGSEAANRETAIEFAERVVLPGEHDALDLPRRILARGDDVEFVGDGAFAAQTLSIDVEEIGGEVTGVFSVSDIVFVRVECVDTDTDGVIIIGGTVTEGDPDHVGDVGDLLSLTIREGDPDRVNIGYDASWASCADLLESLPHDDFNESDFVAVAAGSDIETG